MKSLTCGLLPGESKAVVERNNEPLRAYLQHRLGRRVELVVGSSYVATGEALRRGDLDLAYLGPVTYVLQSRCSKIMPFVRPNHGGDTGPTFKAAIITAIDSPITCLEELRGHELAMGDLASTSATWVPRHMMLGAGLRLDRDYRRAVLGTHDAVAAAVVARRAVAGTLSLPILQRLVAEGRIDGGALRILAASRPIPEYMWTFRSGLDTALREEIRRAFISLDDPAVLANFRAESFIPAVDADVDRVRHWMEEILQAPLLPQRERNHAPHAASLFESSAGLVTH